MKKVFLSLLVVLVGLFAIDRIGGMAMHWVNRHTQDILAPKFRYISEQVCEDVVMIGASRCHHHYVPSIIADSIGMSVYNCGIRGSENIYSHYMSLCLILKRHRPKVVCLELMNLDVMHQAAPFTKLAYYAPYFGYSDSADSLFMLGGSYWKYKLSHLYRYNAKAVSNIAGLFVNRQENEEHGYVPAAKNNVRLGKLNYVDAALRPDPQKMLYLKRFTDLCRREGCKIVFTISPFYCRVSSALYTPMREFAKKENIPFLDYHTPGLFLDHPEYFRDPNHLNDRGARAYSAIFAADLKKVLVND